MAEGIMVKYESMKADGSGTELTCTGILKVASKGMAMPLSVLSSDDPNVRSGESRRLLTTEILTGKYVIMPDECTEKTLVIKRPGQKDDHNRIRIEFGNQNDFEKLKKKIKVVVQEKKKKEPSVTQQNNHTVNASNPNPSSSKNGPPSNIPPPPPLAPINGPPPAPQLPSGNNPPAAPQPPSGNNPPPVSQPPSGNNSSQLPPLENSTSNAKPANFLDGIRNFDKKKLKKKVQNSLPSHPPPKPKPSENFEASFKRAINNRRRDISESRDDEDNDKDFES